MLLIKSTKTVKLNRKSPKILKFSTAVEGYVYVETTEGDTEKLVHINQEGKILWQRDYKNSVDTFGMFNEREVITMNVNTSNIQIIDIKEQKIRFVSHQFAFEDTASMEIYVFNDSRLFAIVQKGSPNDNRLFITYYSYDNYQSASIISFQSKGEWTYGQSFEKVNNHSKFAWWKAKLEDMIEFFTFDLKESRLGQLKAIKVSNNFKSLYNMNTFALEIANLWETAPNVFMLVCNSNRAGKESQEIPNNNYILDVDKQITREVKFTFPNEWNKKLIDYFNLGQISAFHTYRFENGKAISSPVYYVHNEREEIMAIEQWIPNSKTSFYIPGFDTSTVIEATHETGDVEEVNVTVKRLMTPKEMYLHFLLHINDDFDDDLLHDAINLLTDF